MVHKATDASAENDRLSPPSAAPWVSPISFESPTFIARSAWLEHAPFAFWIVQQLEPRLLVELGTHRGYSYFAFCQAVRRERLSTRCFAVDTWEGDEHAGFYGPEVFESVDDYNREHYAGFSSLLKMTFEAAAEHFADGTVDLLHIDGRHFYEDVREDFETWRPKLSDRAVVLFHDVNVFERDFGVHRFWAELTDRWPGFSFLHGHGLGVLAVGAEVPRSILKLMGEWDGYAVRNAYSRLGGAITDRWQFETTRAALEDRDERARSEAATLRSEVRHRDRQLAQARAEAVQAGKEAARARDEAGELHSARKHVEEVLRAQEDPVRQLEEMHEQAEARERAWNTERRHLLEQKREAERRVRAIQRSTSWRLTRPLRLIGSLRRRVLRLERHHLVLLLGWLRTGDVASARAAVSARLADGVADSPETSAVPVTANTGRRGTHRAPDLTEVRQLRASGDLAAADAAAQALAKRSQQPSPLREAADIAMLRHDWDEAARRWLQCLENPGHVAPNRLRARLALAARRSGDLQLAEEACRRGLAEDPNDVGLLREHAQNAMAQADWAAALRVWRRITELSDRTSLARAGTRTCERLLEPERLDREIAAYHAARSSSRAANQEFPRVAVVSAIAGGYDPVHLPLSLDPSVEHVLFTDRPVDGATLVDVRPLPYHDVDPARSARFVKTHLPHLLPDVDVAIWVDSNVLCLDGYEQVLSQLFEGPGPMAAIPHPLRSDVYAEAKACLERGKDDPEAIRRQIERYRVEGLGPHELIESNLMAFNLRDPHLQRMCATWWSEIDRGSRRDQLSLAYSVARHRLPWQPLMPRPMSLRDHPDFVVLEHGAWDRAATAMHQCLAEIDEVSATPHLTFADVRGARLEAVREITVDVVVCVHNALDEVRECLWAIERTRRPRFHRLVIVDDGSDAPTSQALREHVDRGPNAMLHRNEVATGYTRAANVGLHLSDAQYVVLLNSDTIPTTGWIDKLVDALRSTPGTAIAGPLSNAASHQSIPDHLSTASQTAVNTLPEGHDAESINRLCESWSAPEFPRVPLVHGFCFALSREVLNAVGRFDENSFPNGYGEENDYCFRAVDAGFGLVIATNTFVYHVKSSSYDTEQRVRLMRSGNENLRTLHGRPRIDRAVRAMQQNPTLRRIRDLARELQ